MATPPSAKIKGLALSVLGPDHREMSAVLLFLLMYRHDPKPLDTLIGWLQEDGLDIPGIEEQADELNEALGKRIAELEKEAEA